MGYSIAWQLVTGAAVEDICVDTGMYYRYAGFSVIAVTEVYIDRHIDPDHIAGFSRICLKL